MNKTTELTFAYFSVYKNDQNEDLQLDDLKRHDFDQLFTEKVSGADKSRPAYKEMMWTIRTGDQVVVW